MKREEKNQKNNHTENKYIDDSQDYSKKENKNWTTSTNCTRE